METQRDLHKNEQFLTELEDCAKQLVENLQNNNFDGASELIHTLVEARDRHIFQSVGRLTRGLHNAIVNFNVDADFDNNPPEINNSEIRDASDRLNYVIKMTQEAADKTMDKVESIAPIAMNLGQEATLLRADWQKLKRREISKEEFKVLYDRMGTFLDQMDMGTQELNKSLQDIILEQGYQDLTGQVLKKVIGLVTDVESELVNLMRIAGEVEHVTGMAGGADTAATGSGEAKNSKGEGPQIHAETRDDVVSGQDDVDDLLSSLGF
ncbi:protein phosphatase CheZ [Saccharophagus degradans]|uniref:Protein phosphatase CheZ n=2 Tax=Saccharophagus degradans TaxID=86304 RepID=Q21IQ7_SACD2|nr:protein phosphatase CheZ [Saccharophagus degradans]ABD81422.1 Chemotaxis phosphatase, CheZ [Saccharophagus degradans 2-40]MBU2985822.1 protein phosphatase CheZ [Saccharophagus degradans]MDO6421027.1 protein phosphatase CheZ [Saccharophagus degradans]MDO6606062.1 protein phosphatase CheZ [Saccharophagus degradans]